MIELSILLYSWLHRYIDITQKFIDRWIDEINRVVKVEESSANILSLSLHIFTFYSCLLHSFTFVFVLILLIFGLIMT